MPPVYFLLTAECGFTVLEFMEIQFLIRFRCAHIRNKKPGGGGTEYNKSDSAKNITFVRNLVRVM